MIRGTLIASDGATAGSPPSSEFPSAANTGHSWGESPPSGSVGGFTVTQSDTVYSGLQINGNVTLAAGVTGVQFLDCRWTGGWLHAPYDAGTERVLVEDCTMYGSPSSYDTQGCGGSGFVIRRCDISGYGILISQDYDSLVEDNYLHDHVCGGSAHGEAFLCSGGSGNIVRHNTTRLPHTACLSSCISFYGDFKQQDNQLVENNLILGAGGFALYAGSVPGKPYPVATNFRVIDNVFGTDFYSDCGVYGPVTSYQAGGGNEFTGNVWMQTVEPLPGGVSDGDPVNP